MSDVCLASQALRIVFLMYVCACLCLCVSMYPSVPFSQSRILRGKGWHSRRRETHSNKPLIFLAMPRAQHAVLIPYSLFVSGWVLCYCITC